MQQFGASPELQAGHPVALAVVCTWSVRAGPCALPGGVAAAGALRAGEPVLARKVSQTGVVIEATAHTKQKAERRTRVKC